MNQEYLQGLHTHLGVTDDYNTWISAVKDNDNYLKGLHGHLGVKDNYDVWKTAIFGTKKEEVKKEKPIVEEVKTEEEKPYAFKTTTEEKPGDLLLTEEAKKEQVKKEQEKPTGLSGSFYEKPKDAEEVQQSLFNIKDSVDDKNEIVINRAVGKYFEEPLKGFDKWLEDNGKKTLKKIWSPRDKSYRYEGKALTKPQREQYLKEYLGEQKYNEYTAWDGGKGKLPTDNEKFDSILNQEINERQKEKQQEYLRTVPKNLRKDALVMMPNIFGGYSNLGVEAGREDDAKEFEELYGRPLVRKEYMKGRDGKYKQFIPAQDKSGFDLKTQKYDDVLKQQGEYIKSTYNTYKNDVKAYEKSVTDWNKENKDFETELNKLESDFKKLGDVNKDSPQESINAHNALVGNYKDLVKRMKDSGLDDKSTELMDLQKSLNSRFDDLMDKSEKFEDISMASAALGLNYDFGERLALQLESSFLGDIGVLASGAMSALAEASRILPGDQQDMEFYKHINDNYKASINYNESVKNKIQTSLPKAITWETRKGNIGAYAADMLANNSPSILTAIGSGGFGSLATRGMGRAAAIATRKKLMKAPMAIFFGLEGGAKLSDMEVSKKNAPEAIAFFDKELKRKDLSPAERQELLNSRSEQEDALNVNQFQKAFSTIGYGAIAMYAERFGTLSYVNGLNRWANTAGMSFAKKTLYSRANNVFNVGIELLEETGTQLGHNLIDITVLDQDKSMIEGIDPEFLVNVAFSSLAIQGPSMGMNSWNAIKGEVTSRQDRIRDDKLAAELNEIQNVLSEGVGINAKDRKTLVARKREILKEAALNDVVSMQRVSRMTPQEVEQLFEINRENRKDIKLLRELGQSGDEIAAIKNQKDKITDRINERNEKREGLLSRDAQRRRAKLKEYGYGQDRALEVGKKGDIKEVGTGEFFDSDSEFWLARHEYNEDIIRGLGNNVFNFKGENARELFVKYLDEKNLPEDERAQLLKGFDEGVYGTSIGNDAILFENHIMRGIGNGGFAAKMASATALHELLHIQNRKAGIVKDNNIVDAAKTAVGEIKNRINELVERGEISKEDKAEIDKRLEIYDGMTDVNLEELINLAGDLKTAGIMGRESLSLGFAFKSFLNRVVNKFNGDNDMFFMFETVDDVLRYVDSFQGKLAKGDMVIPPEEEEIEKGVRESKAASDNVQRIYEERGIGGAMDIIEEFKPITSRIAERRREAPGFDKELLMSEIEIGERGILDLIREYKPESGVPLAAYINKFLPARAIEASKRVLGEEFVEDVSERVDIAAEEVTTEVKAKPKKRKIILSDRLGVKNKVNKAIKKKLPKLDIENLDFKTLKDQVPEITGEMFGIAPKKLKTLANITKKELQSAQMFINKNADVLISMLPEGATTGGTATGVPKTLLKEFYTKSDRAKMAKTGTKAGLAVQVKKPNINKKQFLEVFGIIDGKPDRTDRNTSARVLALANLTGKMMTNQAVRSEVEKQGDVSQSVVLKLQDGKSSVMFSKSLPETKHDIYYAKYGDLVTEISNSNNKDIESIKNRVTNIFKDDLTKSEISKISKEIFKNVEQYGVLDKKHVMPSGRKIDMPQTLQEFLIDKAIEDNLDYGVKEMLKKNLPKDKNGKTINIGAHYLDKNRILKHRALPVDLGKQIVEEMGLEKGVEFILKYYQGMFSGLSRIGDGRYIFKNGALRDNPNYEPLVPKKGKDGVVKMVPPKNRKQVFQSVPDFVENVIGKLGVNVYNQDGSVKTVNQIQKDLGINTTLLAEKSEAALKDMDFEGREAQANEAKKAVIKMMDFVTKTIGYDSADVGMLVTSMGSGMTSVMRRAANFKYMGIGVENSKNPGKELEYEHMIPQVEMSLKVLKGYLENGSVDNSVWEGYHVAIIPKTMDDVLVENRLRSKSPVSGNRYYNMLTFGDKRLVAIKSIDPKDKGLIIGEDFVKASNMMNKTAKEVQDIGIVDRAYKTVMFSKSANNPVKGITVLDFDDTLATTESLVKYTTPEGETGTLNAEQYASTYEDLLDRGYTFDFSDFNKVVKGKLAPLFNKALKLQGKFGPKNMFVLTARPPAAQKPIFDFLKANGLNIPLENITGLGNSTSEAKALWIADKVADGYNDFYFADDALQNVQAVKNMLDQFDVKSKVQQAKVKFSKSASKEFNDILEQTKGLPSDYMISQAKARQRGKRKGLFQFFVPPSADDFAGLLQMFQGKGKQGMEHAAWFKKNLLDPFARGDRSLNGARQRTAEEFKALRKKFPEVSKKLRKVIPTGDYTFGDAIRVYLWDKNDIEVPGLTKTDKNNMLKLVKADPELQAFADVLGVISRKEDGYITPDEYWMTKDIVADITEDGIIGDGRKDHLAEWIENKDLIFTPENLNKIEFLYGSNFREALEDSLYRMENGTSRPVGSNRVVNNFLNWMNGGISVVMNWNTRSAVLQTLSTVNFINWGDNNILAAGKAFANQKQYWKDFAFLFNSDMLKQRRAGLKTSIESSELMSEVEGAVNPVRAAIRYLLRIGFTPTKFADSFAIASGGASFYRNRINTYKKQGYNQTEAEAKAFLDFQETAEEAQQSSRPDRLSQQQTSVLGRLILAFQNTPMQYVRISKKEILDLVNGRFTGFTGPNSFASKTGKIMYYTALQNLIFYSMQTALFAAMFSDEEDDEEFFDKKTERIFDNMADGVLRGMGVSGAVISTLKNIILKYIANKDSKMYDESAILMEGLKLSPPLSIKARQLLSADKTMRYNRDVIKQMETFDIDNPMWNAAFNVVEMTTNAPLSRMESKYKNVRNALDNRYETWQRVAFMLGYNTWSLGVKNEEIEEIKKEIKAIKTYERKKKAQEEKQAKQAEKQALINKDVEKEKKLQEEGKLKDPKCRHVNTKGERCSVSVANAGDLCTIHEEVLQRADGKKTRCKQVKADGKRCGMQTSNKSGYCYYHD